MIQTSSSFTIHRSPTTSLVDFWEGSSSSAANEVLMQVYQEATLPTTRTIILNFQGQQVMNSHTISLLILLLIRARQKQQHVLAIHVGSCDRRIFSLTGLDKHIGIFETEEQARLAVYRARSEERCVIVPFDEIENL